MCVMEVYVLIYYLVAITYNVLDGSAYRHNDRGNQEDGGDEDAPIDVPAPTPPDPIPIRTTPAVGTPVVAITTTATTL